MRYRATVSASMIWLLIFSATNARAVTVAAHSISGLMQQPTSQYYHLVYGAGAEISNDAQTVIGRIAYIERPVFAAAGFIDQESFIAATIGSKVTRRKNHGLYAFFGAGRVSGYIKPDPDITTETNLNRRGFSMNAATLTIEYGGQWQQLFASLSHQTMIGLVDKAQSEIKVAWPYQFFLANLGMRL